MEYTKSKWKEAIPIPLWCYWNMFCQCPRCGKRFLREENYHKHYMKHHTLNIDDINEKMAKRMRNV